MHARRFAFVPAGWLLFGCLLPARADAQGPRAPRRIIDMHLQAYATAPEWASHAPNPVTGAALMSDDEESHRRACLQQMGRHHIMLAVIGNGTASSDVLVRWMAAAPGLFLPAIGFDAPGEGSIDSIRKAYREGRLKVIGGIGAPDAGHSAGDSVYEPWFALAEELDIPIAVHAGTGTGPAVYAGSPRYRERADWPLHLDEMLARHPRARVQLVHAGWPFLDETLALLHAHPQVYVDLGLIDWTQPRADFHGYLRRLVAAGYARRIMFGSEPRVWPEAIGMAVESVEAATFLSEAQKRDIFYNNAARFLRLPLASGRNAP